MIGFLLRWAFAFLLLSATYNPTPYNYVVWASANFDETLSLVVLAGLFLAICYIIYLRATLRSIGVLGMALVLALFGAIVWVLTDLNMISWENTSSNMWLAIVALSFMLGIGMAWSFVRRALTGQIDVDDVEN
ncbi:MAG: DUF6524 family protein [Shimia sp.]